MVCFGEIKEKLIFRECLPILDTRRKSLLKDLAVTCKTNISVLVVFIFFKMCWMTPTHYLIIIS